jgi:hypothetical protein
MVARVTETIAAPDLTALYGADPGALTYDRTIDRRVLHKWAVEAVLVTDSLQPAENEFLVAGMLPRANSPGARAISQRFSRYDFCALFELTRQAMLVVAHRYLDIPAMWATLLFGMRLELVDVSATGPMTKPVTVICKVSIERHINKRGRLTGADYMIDIFAEHKLIARAAVTGQITSPDKYKVVRQSGRDALLARDPPAPAPVTPVDPELVGMRPGSSTVVGDLSPGSTVGAFTARICIDPDDVFYYDHPISHVPGLVSCEGLRQAALLAICRTYPPLSPHETLVRKLEAKFDGYGEPDIDLDVELALGAAGPSALGTTIPVDAVLAQLDRRLVTARFELEVASTRTVSAGER